MSRGLWSPSVLLLAALAGPSHAVSLDLRIPDLPPLPRRHSAPAQKLLNDGLAAMRAGKTIQPPILARRAMSTSARLDAMDKARTDLDTQLTTVREAASSASAGGGSCPT